MSYNRNADRKRRLRQRRTDRLVDLLRSVHAAYASFHRADAACPVSHPPTWTADERAKRMEVASAYRRWTRLFDKFTAERKQHGKSE